MRDMATTRRFLLASSLARLIERERGGHRVTEGYFPICADRSSYVQLAGNAGSLVLITTGPGAPVEDRTEVPRAHAEALLTVTAGAIDYVRTDMSIGPCEVRISRFITPGPLDLISVEFEREEEARDFLPLPWFGPEVTADLDCHNQMIALEGLQPAPEVALSNGAIDALLDTLENRFASRQRPLRPAAAVRAGSPRSLTSPMPDTLRSFDVGQDGPASDFDDNEIREMARSLRPRRQ
jgi:CYTH domain-containing protein